MLWARPARNRILRGAIDAWRRAIALAPDDYDVLFNLAILLHQQRRDEEARPYVERFVRDAPPARYASDIATLRALLANEKGRAHWNTPA